MKTKEELNAIKEEVETLNKKLAELNDEEMAYVSGGSHNNEGTGIWRDPNSCRSRNWSDYADLSISSPNNGGETVWDKIE